MGFDDMQFSQSRHLALLTFVLVGLQFTWSVEMTYFTPYLLELGLAKSQAALVWLAPPLSGMIVQPIIGTISDSSTSRFGRRRPFLIPAAFIVVICMLTLGWASDICHRVFTADAAASKATIALAVFCIYALDFAINCVQATARSLIVDTLPLHQQQLGSAWAGRMLGFGTLLGYCLGTIHLQTIFGDVIGDTQFKRICVITSIVHISCVLVTCLYVTETVLPPKSSDELAEGILKPLKTIAVTTLHLPKKIQSLCWVTFWTWIGWSPFHVYGTTWVGEIYYHQTAKTLEELRNSTDVVGDIARKGSFALLLFSIASFAGSITLPWVVALPGESELNSPDDEPAIESKSKLERFRVPRVDICTAWGFSQLVFCGSLVLAPLMTAYWVVSLVVAFCGIPWAMYGWAPLAILGEEITKLGIHSEDELSASLLSQNTIEDREEEMAELEGPPSREDQDSTPLVHRKGSDPNTAPSASAGVYLGIWNIYATIPQFVATFIAMVAFRILEPGKGIQGTEPPSGDIPDGGEHRPGPPMSGTATCLAIGALCSGVAAILTFRLRKL